MQSPAAYTLPVKLLTSTNDFLMIGPSIPQSCLLTNTHTRTHTPHTCAPTHIHNEFYQGKYMWFNGSLQMPFPLTLLYLSSNKMPLFPSCHLFFWRRHVRCMNTPNDDVSRESEVPREQRNKLLVFCTVLLFLVIPISPNIAPFFNRFQFQFD